MTRADESGAYLGGIGTMLTNNEVCTSCGQVHEKRQFTFRHNGNRECPDVVMGSFPVLTRPPLTMDTIAPLRQKDGDVEPVYPGLMELAPKTSSRKVGLFSGSWSVPMPQEEFL
ncbi:MAG: hypothetical protein WAN87_08860 [Thermoplasmata archaeon]